MAALVALATVSDLEDLLEVDVTDTDRAEALLAAASTLVRAETGSAWVDADGDPIWVGTEDEKLMLVADALTQTVVAAAARAWRNPQGVVSETKGPFTIRHGEEAAFGLFLTDSERDVIGAAVRLWRGASSPGLWTLRTSRSDGNGDTEYVDVQPPGAPLPYLDPVTPY